VSVAKVDNSGLSQNARSRFEATLAASGGAKIGSGRRLLALIFRECSRDGSP